MIARMKRLIVRVVVAIAALAFIGWVYCQYAAYRFHAAVDAAIPLDTLRYVEFQPGFGEKLVRIDDPGSMAEVKAWLLRAQTGRGIVARGHV